MAPSKRALFSALPVVAVPPDRPAGVHDARTLLNFLLIPTHGSMMVRVHLKDFDESFVVALDDWLVERLPLVPADADRALWAIFLARASKRSASYPLAPALDHALAEREQRLVAAGAEPGWWRDPARWQAFLTLEP